MQRSVLAEILRGEPCHSSPGNMMLGGQFKNKCKNTTIYKIDNQQGPTV